MEDEVSIDDGCGWAVAGVLCDLDGAVLTTRAGEGGLAGALELAGSLALAANDAHFEREEAL